MNNVKETVREILAVRIDEDGNMIFDDSDDDFEEEWDDTDSDEEYSEDEQSDENCGRPDEEYVSYESSDEQELSEDNLPEDEASENELAEEEQMPEDEIPDEKISDDGILEENNPLSTVGEEEDESLPDMVSGAETAEEIAGDSTYEAGFNVEDYLHSRLPKITAGNIMIKSRGAAPIILVSPNIPKRHLNSAVEYIGMKSIPPEDVIGIITYRVLGSTYKAGTLFGRDCFIFRGLIKAPDGYGMMKKGMNPDQRITIYYRDLPDIEISFSESGRDKMLYGPELRLKIRDVPVTLYDSSAHSLSNLLNDMKFRISGTAASGN